jgi:thioredoxin-dependent peroxiredoxin
MLSRTSLSLPCSLVAGLLLAGSSLSLAAETPAPPAATPPAPPVEATLLAPGTPAPDFTATAHNGEKVTLSKLKGKNVVLYWYPKDDTPGCTKQACDIRDNWDKLKKAGVVVYGVSTQDNTSHQVFAEKHKLPFALLPDEKGEIAQKFGVPVVNGKARRMSVLIGKDGKVKHVWPKAATTGHAQEILAAVEAK